MGRRDQKSAIAARPSVLELILKAGDGKPLEREPSSIDALDQVIHSPRSGLLEVGQEVV